jgi:hypothetical protein
MTNIHIVALYNNHDHYQYLATIHTVTTLTDYIKYCTYI